MAFKWLGKAIAGPFKAIGHVAQGKFRKALGDIGDTGKVIAPILGATGIGLPLAAGIGAASSAAEKYGHGENNIGRIAGAGLKGAAIGAAGAAARPLVSGASGLFSGGGEAAGLAGEGALTGSSVAGAPSTLSSIGAFAAKNPVVASEIVKAPLQAYGMSQQGAYQDEEAKRQAEQDRLAEEERQRRFRLDQLQTMIGGLSSFRPRY